MDETQQSCTSEAAAAATRKRRSSILKSQRPPRTPFSELEFHVTTPPDTAKSRRVSFSRRTGVAEFITNEATTTWKTFYEEHNKSMESSGNESAMNPPRQTIGHLGKRMFDQQFQEVMAVDLITTNDNLSNRNVSNSFNNVNLTQQLAALECNTGANLSLPQQKFELSAVTDHQSKLFDDLAVPIMGEMSGKIDINFSAVQTIGSGEGKDDLDEIQKDLERVRNNIVCAGPFTCGRDMSGYIEVDLNATHVTIPNDVSDMSITDTITSPKMQDAPRNSANNKSNTKKDWVEDKENIGAYVGCSVPVDPINERRRTVVYENDTGNISITQAIASNIILEEHKTSDKRKTIVYESDSGDISVTQAVPVNILITNKNEKRKTIIYESDKGNISITQAIPTNIILQDKTKTIISKDDFGNISITQAVPSAKIISDENVYRNINETGGHRSFVQIKDSDKRKTIVYENEDANISETQVIPPNIMSTIEIKAAVPNSPVKSERISFGNTELTNKRKTIVFDDDIGNISITQAVPTNIIVSNLHNRSNIHDLQEDCLKIKDNDNYQDIECKDNVIINKRKTIVFDEDNNISITQAIPTNILISHAVKDEIVTPAHNTTEIKQEPYFDKEISLLDIKRPVENKRHTVVFESNNADANMSITQAIPHDKLIKVGNLDVKHELSSIDVKNTTDTRRRTVVFDKSSDNADMSITEALPRENLLDELNINNMGKSKDITPLDEINVANETKRKTIVFEEGNDMSITEAIPNDHALKDLIKTREQVKDSISSHSNLITESKHKYFNLPQHHFADTQDLLLLDTESQNMSIRDTLAVEDIATITNKSHIYEVPIQNKEILLESKRKTNELHNWHTANVPMQATKPQEDVIEKSIHTTLSEANKSVTHKPKVSIFEKVNNTIFVSTMEVQDNETEDVKSDNINDVSMTNGGHKSVLMEREKSIVNEELNNSELINFNCSRNKPNAQDILVYQAVTHINVSDKESRDHRDCAAFEDLEKKTVSFRNSVSNESEFEVDRSVQMSETWLDKQNSEAIEETESNTALKATQVTVNQSKVTEKPKKSILDELLDMSSTSINTSAHKNAEGLETQNDKASNNSFIHVKDSDEESQTDKEVQTDRTLKCEKSQLLLEYKDEEEPVNITKKSYDLKVHEKLISPKYIHEKLHSADLEKSLNKTGSLNTEVKEKLDESKTGNSFRDANDTNELLEMLSDLTDKSRVFKDDEKQKEAVKNGSHFPEVTEPRRLSVAPNRLSIVISREDLLNNISMAQAALQKSIEIDESLAESTPEESPQKKPNRISNEVAKKLEFDESDSEISVKDIKTSPLTKSAFSESECTKVKVKVIPSYMNNVSLELKSLMNDLVKPNIVAVPFQAAPEKSPVKDPSTCSIQIQANLITSSQIDIDTEANSIIGSTLDDYKNSLPNVSSKSFSSSIKTTVTEKRVPLEVSFAQSLPSRKSASESDRVIVFDHRNPLNNIFLAPPDYSNVHRYNPSFQDNTSSENNTEKHNPEPDYPKPVNKVQYNIETVLISQNLKQAGDSEMLTESKSNESKSPPMHVCELKDTKVNTIIAMKANKELLEASSSLTLVDDAVANFDVLDSEKSPVKIIYKYQNDSTTENKDSDFTSTDDTESMQDNKPKKRNYSLTKSDKYQNGLSNGASLDVTPKPISKMLRMSNSPKPNNTPEKLIAKDNDQEMEVDDAKKEDITESPKKRPGTDITVQQLITEYNIKDDIDQELLNKQILEALSQTDSSTAPNTVSISDVKSADIVSSFTSSKNQDEMLRTTSSVTTASVRTREWNANDSNKSSVSECESSVNVVAKIDMLPFMGSHECEWEPSGIDTWSFRLLHARLRLTVRLAHRHDNATRTRVRADTPILNVTLENTHADKKNSVASLCIGFAAEAMRYFIARGCNKAGDIPTLLRRCAAVARLALRWGRAMYEARQQLAYNLTGDGVLAIKVANIPLRSVWEVTMRLELVVVDAREVPWPRAYDVHVSRVVSDVNITDDEVKRVLMHLPRDWGHAPRAIWKIFRHLKNKTRDDEILLLT